MSQNTEHVMGALILELLEQLHQEFTLINPEDSPVKGHDRKIYLVELGITRMREMLEKHPFPDRRHEISYFKCLAPSIFKLQVFYTELYQIEIARITAMDTEEFIQSLENKKTHMTEYLKKYTDLRLYHHLKRSNRDEELFTSRQPTASEKFLAADRHFCEQTIVLSNIMAYEDVLPILREELGALMEKVHIGNKIFEWRPNKAQTAEIIYSFVKMKCISVNGKDADIKDLVSLFKEEFNYDAGNIYDVQLHNKRRKKDQAPFLREMIDTYLASE